MTDRQETFQTLAKRYEEQTGIKVNIELYAPSDDYSRKIVAAAQANVLPDIFGILEKKRIFASFINSGFVADLTDAFKVNDGQWEKILFEKALAMNIFEEGNSYNVKPGIYGVPLDMTSVQMLYNIELLKKAGIEKPPQTFDEFLECVYALKGVGVAGFVSGWGEIWLIESFALNYAFNIMGEDRVMATFKGEVPYTDPDWIKVFNVFRDLTYKKAFIKGIVTKGNKYAEQDFALERAAFAFNGSWCVNVYNKMNPNLRYSVMLPPRISDEHPMTIWGGAGSSFVVNGKSKKIEQAIDFLRWLTAEEQQIYFATETKNLPANKEALASLDPILLAFAKNAQYVTHPAIWALNEDEQVTEALTKGIQSIIIGDKTPQGVAKDVQAIKKRIMEKISRQRH